MVPTLYCVSSDVTERGGGTCRECVQYVTIVVNVAIARD